jgi:aerobic-type carbon monoxide dehydrogenase small subunit (CoxS/CutS family)
MPSSIELSINGKKQSVQTDPERSLLEVIREDLRLTGTHYGCGEGACGSCGVLVDGKRMFSCSTTVGEVAGKSIVTIEGISDGENLHPVQQAFLDEGAFQCAYCTSGMIINAIALLKRNAKPSEDEIRKAMEGNICRCCAHPRIIKAIQRASETATVRS